ncbi:hypothetical protein [Prosthecobacter sp.]|uniref:hypothetical protein n=1 Tax=Prosthecobacter sp. TaxID=1965333 RepID=UPI002AB8B0B2|nr:hypothetical protein [Prosthecobacter sp.]MDZ4402069.1 hypothetical protein [Prosthecobacter sp.]
MKLCATECVFDELDDDGIARVWFADQSQTPPTYFTLCRAATDPGHNAYFERDDQKWGSHGRVINAHLTTNSVTMQLDAGLAASLALKQVVEISFMLGKVELNSLERCLVAILGSDVVTRSLDHHDHSLQR